MKNKIIKLYNPQDIIKDLRKLGIKEDDCILIHSSYKSLYKNSDGIIGTMDDVIDALKETVKKGTLMLPSLSYDSVGENNPVFDANNTPCCVGALPENFRKSADVYRSLCATHSVAIWGKNAKQIAYNHLNSTTPAGENSPFRYLKNNGGKIVMLGCGLFCNTSMHGVEELVYPDYLFKGEVNYKIIDMNNNEHSQLLKRHYFKNTTQRYDRIVDVMPKEYIKRGNVLDADTFVIDAKEMWICAEKKMLEDNRFFVDMG